MFRLVIQLAIFVILSLCTGSAFSRLGLNFYLGVATGCALQYVGNYLFTIALNAYVQLKNKKLENERIKEFTMQGIEVECPCSKKHRDFIPIRLNTTNKYKCKDCQKTISVFINPSTALATEPILDTDTSNPLIIANGLDQ
jgi:hypothetical protein